MGEVVTLDNLVTYINTALIETLEELLDLAKLGKVDSLLYCTTLTNENEKGPHGFVGHLDDRLSHWVFFCDSMHASFMSDYQHILLKSGMYNEEEIEQ